MRRRPEDVTVIPVQREWRPGPDGDDDLDRLRGLVHDLGHGLATVSLLLEAARGHDSEGFPDPVLDLVELETRRLLAVAHGGVRRAPPAERRPLRPLLAQLTDLADLAGPASVRLGAGPEIHLGIDPVLLWRVVSNLVDNAVRAAGCAGRVDVRALRAGGEVVLEVADDGPGFRRGPSGTARLGLGIVRRLLDECGGPAADRGRRPARHPDAGLVAGPARRRLPAGRGRGRPLCLNPSPATVRRPVVPDPAVPDRRISCCATTTSSSPRCWPRCCPGTVSRCGPWSATGPRSWTRSASTGPGSA